MIIFTEYSPLFFSAAWNENQGGLLKLISKINSHQKSIKLPMKNIGYGPDYVLEFLVLKYCSKTESSLWRNPIILINRKELK